MHWTKKYYAPYNETYVRYARKDNFKCVLESMNNGKYYFLTRKGMFIYNSLWDDLKYDTEEECMIACEEWIKEHKNDEGRKRTVKNK